MGDTIPEGKFRRTVTGTGTAAKVSGKVLKYIVKKPFLSEEKKKEAKKEMTKDSAAIIFKTLTMLKGTALKIAQFLSLELDLLPEELRSELSKSYNRVPPLNRAIVRKVVTDRFTEPPEKLFKKFDSKAFAAASLGQVHRAQTHDGRLLALKIQYPGIQKTIKSDLSLVRTVVRPMSNSDFLLPMLDEVETKLMEETDYINEGKNQKYLRDNLKIENVVIPGIIEEYSRKTVLASDYIEGLSLNDWLVTNPTSEERNKIASILYEIFIKGIYELNCIHADPNPGNFIITKDLKIGLVDFGCIKKFTPQFVEKYKMLNKSINSGDYSYKVFLDDLGIIKESAPDYVKEDFYNIMLNISKWYRRFYEVEYFDFSKNEDIFKEPQKYFKAISKYRKYYHSQPDFIFLDRTRYGIYRIFEIMKAKIKIRNSYEMD